MEPRENVMRVARWWINGWLGLFRFHGRVRRAELWSYLLGNVVIFGVIDQFFGEGATLVFALVQDVPMIALLVRRLHDLGRDGVMALIVFVPIAGPILILVYMVLAGEVGPNRFGPDPKAPRHEPLMPVGPVRG
jgi:uncharacterized membrane protein YhaH (DUF805 family)